MLFFGAFYQWLSHVKRVSFNTTEKTMKSKQVQIIGRFTFFSYTNITYELNKKSLFL
jgi:hypothetical protein